MHSSWLPLPVARLQRRSRNAKSPRDRHDAAFYGWEVSIRLAVAAALPAEIRGLQRASFGQWAQCAPARVGELRERELLDLYALLRSVIDGQRSQRASISVRELFDALAAYRNRVLGHGSTRDASFYEELGHALLAALDIAWQAEVFLPPSGRVVQVDSIALDPGGARRARLIDLSGETPSVSSPGGVPVPALVSPHQLHWRAGDQWIALWPWLIFDDEEERLYCFNGLGRHAMFLDFGSGATIDGAALEGLSPGIEAELRGRFAMRPDSRQVEAPKSTRADDAGFGDFELIGQLGSGGMGEIWIARQASLDRRVALKILPERLAGDLVAKARFRREVQALSRCDHPNVVKILSSGEARGRPYFAMELVEGVDLEQVSAALAIEQDLQRAVGRTLDTLRGTRGALLHEFPSSADVAWIARQNDPFRELACFFRDAARGVQHLHDHGILHRDIKPANIVVSAHDGRPVIMDLGLAKLDDSTLTLTREQKGILGTLRYLPPEQLHGNLLGVDRRADVYSLGATLYELLSMRPIFDGDSEARLLEQVLREEPLPLRNVRSDVPKDLAAIVRKATEKDPRLRYDTVGGMEADLDAFVAGRPVEARGPSVSYYLWLAASRNKRISAAIVALLCLAAMLVHLTLGSVEVERDRDAVVAMQRLRHQAEADLWPASPARLSALEHWLEEANAIAPRVERIARRLRSGEKAEGGEFAAVTEIETFLEGSTLINGVADPLAATVPAVAERRESFSRVVRESVESDTAQQRWKTAIAAIAAEPCYHGLRLTPQMGLLPLRPDPDSGLWEFLHVPTGAEPEIGETGRYVLNDSTGVVLVLLPGGQFWKGSQDSDELAPGYDPFTAPGEGPPVETQIDPFFLSKYEMTQAQWTRVTGINPSGLRPAHVLHPTLLHPVETVSWRAGTRVLRCLGLELPTTAQWEYGARAGTTTPWWTGSTPESLLGAANYADRSAEEYKVQWFSADIMARIGFDDGFPITAPVGSLRANPFGLHDVHGNVWEWCSNGPEQVYAAAESEAEQAARTIRSIRGGGWQSWYREGRCADQKGGDPDLALAYIGVRPAREVLP